MRYLWDDLRLFLALGVLCAAADPSTARGRQPEKSQPEKRTSSNSSGSLKTEANQALNGLDKGIHSALKEAKEGANEALEAVDKTIHKAIK
jgi:hypothetical protein